MENLTTFFFLLFSICVAPTFAEKKHFCKYINARQFKEIGLQSVSWDDNTEVLIFTEPELRFYSLKKGSYSWYAMEMANTPFGNIANRDKYNRAFSYIKKQTVKATYMFRLDHYGWGGQKHIILMVTNNGTLSGNFKDNAWDITHPDGHELPDFSLVNYPKNLMKLKGYVLNADILTGFIVLSAFEVHWEDSKIIGLPKPKGYSEKDRPFFYIEVGIRPNEVFLVHSSVRPDPHAQLLAAVPRSILIGEDMVLFDSSNGCVYIIKGITSFDVAKANKDTTIKRHPFKRANYPFEEYFKCGPSGRPINSDRCNTAIRN